MFIINGFGIWDAGKTQGKRKEGSLAIFNARIRKLLAYTSSSNLAEQERDKCVAEGGCESEEEIWGIVG